MVKFFKKGTSEEVKMGDTITRTTVKTTEYGTTKTVDSYTLTPDNVKLFIDSGVLEAKVIDDKKLKRKKVECEIDEKKHIVTVKCDDVRLLKGIYDNIVNVYVKDSFGVYSNCNKDFYDLIEKFFGI